MPDSDRLFGSFAPNVEGLWGQVNTLLQPTADTAAVLRSPADPGFYPEETTHRRVQDDDGNDLSVKVRLHAPDRSLERAGGGEFAYVRDLMIGLVLDDPMCPYQPQACDVWRVGDVDYRVEKVMSAYPPRVALERLPEPVAGP